MSYLDLQHKPRPSGYVTQALINEHGSFRKALEWLNATAKQHKD